MKEDILKRLAAGEDLSMDEMADTLDSVMQGAWATDEIASLLRGLADKGETFAEVAGAAVAMRKHMTPIRSSHERLIDTCGTGGDGSGTFNISTAAALVTAAAGVPVAKHGNRRITSKTGSSDVLAELGVNIEANVEQVEACLEELGICFCFAPLLHQAMKHVAEVRRSLGVPTIFNLLGPLTNPAGASYQLLGVGNPERRELMAEALSLLSIERAAVVHGDDGLDEVTLSGPTRVTLVDEEGPLSITWMPTDFGLEIVTDRSSMLVAGPADSAAIIRNVLAGKHGPPREIVVLNAAAALWMAGEERLKACALRAAEAIDNGAARDLLARLVEVSRV